ncbi:phosphatidate cytidylyltransferase [Rossellomorea aquimaris]|uniref:CDP-diglyceride synthetase n=1 Tax=Rossellomorea aquimaris TaxID=189382 RepID=A0A5D4UBI8_9BACI|nr:phosphatidate cytidylyltransferase [Rossellomorea aquimaris]TYS78724.1 CDP-diglyceride synthetase [Rossellomorea aquimaris]TYS84471.1 CDP-diglyceride synthetase [Rossellomorea aquimaris]
MESAIWTLFVIFIGLVVVTVLFLQIKSKQRGKDFSRISLRVKTWWGMFVVFCLATLFNPIVSMFSLMILCFFSLKEYFSMMQTRKADRRIFLWAYLSIPIQFYWIYIGWYGMFIVFIPVYVFLLLPLPRLLGKGTLGFLRSVSSTQWGLMLMVFGLSHLAYYQVANPTSGANLVLFLVVLTQVSDIVQFVVSIYIGKRKVVPTSNPAITWEGFLAAVLVTTCVSYFIYPFLTPLDMKFGILSGLIISVTGFVGSLTISVLKRDLLIGDQEKFASLKESYLNRVDSLTYTSPIFFHIIRYYFDFM